MERRSSRIQPRVRRQATAIAVALTVLAGWASGAGAIPPEGRTYELIPTNNNQNNFGAVVPSADGTKVFYSLVGGNDESPSGGVTPFLATRSANGWTSSSLMSSRSLGLDSAMGLTAPSSDFSTFAMTAERGVYSGAPKSMFKVSPGGEPQRLVSWPNGNNGFLAATTADLEHIVLQSDTPLVPEDDGMRPAQLYDVGSGEPELLGILPDGSVAPCGAIGPSSAPQDGGWRNTPGQHQVSTDGSHVFFQSPVDLGFCAFDANLYVRHGGQTVALSEPPDGVTSEGSRFVQAAPDGSKAFFTTTTPLTADDEDATRDLYEVETDAGEQTCLTCHFADAPITGAAISPDATTIYFTSSTVLVPGEGEDGAPNVYLLDDGVPSYVGLGSARTNNTITASPADGGAMTTDGSIYVFVSDQQQPGGPDVSGCRDFMGTAITCAHYYRYDASTGDTECVSCPADGSSSTSVSTVMVSAPLGLDPSTPMSADGRIFVFRTQEGLVPRDVNQDLDIYEWRDGAVSLITGGDFASLSNNPTPQLYGISATGQDVFFTTYAPLVDGFPDGSTQIYNARAGSPPSAPPPSPPAPCRDDSCQGQPTAAPEAPLNGSVTFMGPGNLRAPSRGASGPVRARSLRAAIGTSAVLRISTPARGRLTVRGRQLKAATRQVKRKTSIRLTVRLSKRGAELLRSKGRIAVRVKVSFRTASGKASSVSLPVTFQVKSQKKGR